MESVRTRAVASVVQRGPAAIGLAALAAFVLYGSLGAWAGGAPRAAPLPGISLPDVVQNFLLYVPFGTLSVWAFRGSPPIRPAQYLSIIALAFAYSSAMELLQMLSAKRMASPLDVIANVSGAAVGAIAAARTEQALGLGVQGARRAGLTTAGARYLLGALLAGIVITAWYPFDVTLDVSTLSARTRAVRHDPWLWPSSRVELLAQAGRFCTLAAVMTTCLPGLAKRAAPVAAVASVLIAAVVDLGQLAMGSRPTGVAVLASQVAGACAGAAVVALVRGTR